MLDSLGHMKDLMLHGVVVFLFSPSIQAELADFLPMEFSHENLLLGSLIWLWGKATGTTLLG